MAQVFDTYLYDGAGWNIAVGSGDYVGFGGDSGALSPVSQDAFQRYTIKTDGSMSANNGTGQNCKYESATEVSLNGASAVTLNTTNVAQINCSFRFHFQDTSASTTLSNAKFFVYAGTPTTAPPDLTVVAFEHDGSAIQTDTAGGAGRAWNANYGVGGSANALLLTDQASASDHYYYIGASVKPTASGLKVFTMRLEFDAV